MPTFSPFNSDRTVVVCSGMAWGRARMSARHIAEQLSRSSPVLFVDPPMSIATPLRNPRWTPELLKPRLTQVMARVALLRPITVPGIDRRFARDLTASLLRRGIRSALRELDATAVAVLSQGLRDVFDAAPDAKHVLYGTDDYVEGAALMGVSRAWLQNAEAAQLRRADIVIAITPKLVDKWRALGADPVEVPCGVDARHYLNGDATRAADVTLKAPIVGFIGTLSHRIDIPILNAIANEGISLLLVGPRQRTFDMHALDSLLACPNVQWVGTKSYMDLPNYLAHCSVGITPYTHSAFNEASYPLKTLEYLAAGLPAVSTNLTSARNLATSLIRVAETVDEFVGAIRATLGEPSDADTVNRRRSFALANDWSVRARVISDLIGVTT